MRLSGKEDGRSEAVNTAIAMSIRQRERAGSPLPLLYRNYKMTSNYDIYRDKEVDWHPSHTETLIPEEYQKLLNEWLGEMREQ